MANDNMPVAKSPGQKVRFMRRNQDLSMAQMADQADISRSYLWQIETGDHIPSYDVATRISRVLNSTPGKIWPQFEYDEETIVQELVIKEDENMDKMKEMPDLDKLLVAFLEVRASVNQKGSRYAETSSPNIDYQIAAKYLQRLIGLLQLDDINEIAQCLLTASKLEEQGNYEGVINEYNNARNLATKRIVIALIDWNIGNAYREIYDYGNAILNLEKAYNWFDVHKAISNFDLAGMEASLGWLYYRKGDYAKAKNFFEQAIFRWEEQEILNSNVNNINKAIHPDESLLAARRGFSSVLERQGDFQGASENLSRIIVEAENREEWVQVAWANARLGFLHIHTGEWSKAEEEMHAGMELAKDLSRTVANRRSLEILQEIILNNQALLQLRMGNTEEALQLSNQSLDKSRKLNDKRGEAFCHMYCAFIHIARGEWDQGLKHARLSETQFEKMGILYYLPEVYSAQVEIYLNVIGPDAAGPLAEEAVKHATGNNGIKKYQEGIALRSRGKVYARKENWDKARYDLEKSLLILEEVSEVYEEATSRLALVQVLIDASEDLPDLVTEHLEKAEIIANNLGAKLLLEQVGKIKSLIS